MSMWIHFNWNEESIERWEKIRQKGQTKYIVSNGASVFLWFVVGALIIAVMRSKAPDWLQDSSFWISVLAPLITGLACAYGGSKWKWDETEASYKEYLKNQQS